MKYQALPEEQEEQALRLVAAALARAGFRQAPPEALAQLECGQLGLTVSVSSPDFGPLRAVTVTADLRRLRQASLSGPEVLRCGALEADCCRQTARVGGTPLNLTPREFQLLCCLMKNQGLVLTRSQLLGAAWDPDFIGDSRTVDTHVKCLRRKLGSYQNHIVTIRKVGYSFDPNPEGSF